MSDIDLRQKPNRILLALDIFLGTAFFSECYPTEPTPSYVWRVQRTGWITLINCLFFDVAHCETSYINS